MTEITFEPTKWTVHHSDGNRVEITSDELYDLLVLLKDTDVQRQLRAMRETGYPIPGWL